MNSLANINTASNNQANSNSNNNNANVINVMPPGKKKRRRRSDKICVKSSESSVSGEVSLAAMFLVQNILKSQHRPGECGPPLTCRALSQLDSLGLGGKMMSVAVRAGALLLNTTEPSCGGVECQKEDTAHHVQCGLCGERLGRPGDIISLQSDHSVSTSSLAMFGLTNVTVSEFVNPSGQHFRAFSLTESRCEAAGPWEGGDTWYPGHSWRVCRCPVCGQAVGWQWRADGQRGHQWAGLRVDRVADWGDFLLGPLSHLSHLLHQK